MKNYAQPWHDLSDPEIVDAIVACEGITDMERSAFESIQSREVSVGGLSFKQRRWANDIYERLRPDLETAANLVSSGQVPGTTTHSYDWERNRPLKPPGRG